MAETYVTHKIIYDYAENKVNLKRENVKEYRDQVNRLRDNLKTYIDEHPDYNLIKMLGSGSVPKGTALKTLNDMDVAIYIKKSENEPSEHDLLTWLQDRLREAYKSKNIAPEQITINHHCVTISFKGTGLDVDVSPVICDDSSTDYGYLIKKTTGERVLTNIPLHLKFIRLRKDKQPHDYRQVIRLIKWWVKNLKKNDANFRFKSFLAELICAHLADNGLVMKDYVAALEAFFIYIIKSQLKDRIAFTDNYPATKLPAKSSSAMEVFDPVNPDNNIVSAYSDADRKNIVELAHDALDAINEAKFATTQERAVACWRRIFGPSFNL
jgi:tRNA nucleotidyltransferase (CCA-adding enzyme)